MLDLYRLIDRIVDEKGLELPEGYKRRDPNEPNREQKEMYEDKMMRLVKRRFNTQKRQLEKRLEFILPPRKNVDDWLRRLGNEWRKDPKTEKQLLKLFIGILSDAIQIFSQEVTLQVDWTQVNDNAQKWAQEWTTEFLEDLDETTNKRIRRELTSFAGQEAYTLGDVISGLADVGLDAGRAGRIAVTEITRTYAQAEQRAGEALREEFPDVRVVKTWFTNNDALVCPICGPMHQQSVLVNNVFEGGDGNEYMHPPAHPNCRCWLSSRTDIAGDVELQNG